MDITITGRHMTVTDAIDQHAREKAGKLPRYYDRLSKLEVLIEKAEDHRNYKIEFIAHVDGKDHLVVNTTHEDLYNGVEHAVKKMERQLTDLKEKLRNHKH
jgi:putative sigma-54 modulation protein